MPLPDTYTRGRESLTAGAPRARSGGVCTVGGWLRNKFHGSGCRLDTIHGTGYEGEFAEGSRPGTVSERASERFQTPPARIHTHTLCVAHVLLREGGVWKTPATGNLQFPWR